MAIEICSSKLDIWYNLVFLIQKNNTVKYVQMLNSSNKKMKDVE